MVEPAHAATVSGALIVYEQVTSNKRRTVVLIAAFVLIVVAVAIAFNFLIGFGPVGIAIAFVVAGGLAFASYWKSDTVALRLSRAVPADETQYARLHNLVEGLCIAGGLPKPRVYVVEDDAPNAFATGRNPDNAAIAVTTGLLAKMNRVELEGVLAHELSHIKNYDILVSTVAVTLVGVVALLSDIGLRFFIFGGGRRRSSSGGGQGGGLIMLLALVFIVLAPFIARIMQLAVSRRREALADVSAIELTRYPPGLISALEKLKADETVVRSGSRATAHLWIEEPVETPPPEKQNRSSRLERLYNTHPPLDERIEALREL